MKKCYVLIFALFLCAGIAQAQIEKGDTEVSFMGYFSTLIGKDMDVNGTGSLQLSYGKYISSYLQIGIAPILTFSTGEDENGDPTVITNWSGSVFFNLNFSAASKFIPYLSGQYYQSTFDIPEGEKFSDHSYINVGLGFKNFFNEYAAFNTLVTYGFSLAEESQVGILTVMTGLSFIF